jgi:hypothetical protein
MKQFKPTYLYIKTHNVTGLKYFGKTTSNRKRYRGSGHHWVRHIAKHGYDVTTEIVGYFIDQDECMRFALEFSNRHNIVESPEWANERLENGVDGGDTISSRSPEQKLASQEKRRRTIANKSQEEIDAWNKKNSDSVKRYIAENKEDHLAKSRKGAITRKLNNKPVSIETRYKISEANRARTPEQRARIGDANRGKKRPAHSEYMKLKTGLDNKNTRVFEVITPSNITISIIGCSKLNKYCKENQLAFEQLKKHINKGKIEKILAQKPRPEMRKCIGYEIKEIIRNT